MRATVLTRATISAMVVVLAVIVGVFALPALATVPRVDQQEPVTAKDKVDNSNPWEIAWGKTVHALRAGISFRLFERPVWHFKEAASFVVYVKNVTRKSIAIEYPESLFDDCLPTVLDKNGKEQHTMKGGAETLGRRPEPRFLKRELAAGETIEIGHPWFKTFPDGRDEDQEEEENAAPSLTVLPGKYRASYVDLKLRRAGQTAYEEGLSTGQIEFEVKESKKR
jgi:hypothetical protein